MNTYIDYNNKNLIYYRKICKKDQLVYQRLYLEYIYYRKIGFSGYMNIYLFSDIS